MSRTEELFKYTYNKNNNQPIREKNFPAVLCDRVQRDFRNDTHTLFPSLYNATANEKVNRSEHTKELCREICKAYVKLRNFTAMSIASEVGIKLRHYMSRQIIWKHQ